ncbi:MAG: hypothetical protein ACK46Q_10880, partial [Hyphomonas sp.]
EALEDLRMLTNINAGKDEVLQLLLVGQPELRDMVRRPDLIQFAQRIAASYHIPRLGAEGVAGYIAARLRAAGEAALVRHFGRHLGMSREALVEQGNAARLADFTQVKLIRAAGEGALEAGRTAPVQITGHDGKQLLGTPLT